MIASVQTAPTASEPTPVSRSSTFPLLLWLVLQLAAASLAAGRVPLAAKYPLDGERLAAHVLLSAQCIAGALLFPFLLRDWRTAAQVIASAAPFQVAAGLLSGAEWEALMAAIAVVDAWLVTIAIWSSCLPTPRSRMIGVAAASLLTLGGGLLGYLRMEFSASESIPTALHTALPLASTFTALDGQRPWGGWLLISLFSAAGLAVFFARARRTLSMERPSASLLDN
jgi:hypothetical protein